MKFYQFCVLVLLACSINAEDNEVKPECVQAIEEFKTMDRECQTKLGDEFEADFNTSIVESKGHDNQMEMAQAFLNKYCAMSFEFFECISKIKPIAPELECELKPKIMKLQSNIAKGIKSFMTDSCANNGEVLKKLLPHNGFEFVIFNREFQQCHSMPADTDDVKEFCTGLDESRSCMLTVIGDHENKDIAVLVTDFNAKIRTEFDC